MTPRRRTLAHAGAAATVFLTLTAGACNRDGKTTETTTTASVAAPTSLPGSTVSPARQRLLDDPDAVIPGGHLSIMRPDENEVVKAFVRAEQALIRAGMAPVTPDHPDLVAATDGEARAGFQKAIDELRQGGHAYRVPEVLVIRPRTLTIRGESADLTACMTQGISIYTASTGGETKDLYSVDVDADLEKRDGRWLLIKHELVGEFREGHSCAG
jgi:hypothetical protein